MYKLKCYELPEGSKASRGTNIVNLLELGEGEKIAAMIKTADFDEGKYIVMVTKNGKIKRTPLTSYRNVRKNGLIAIGLDEGDEIAGVRMTFGDNEVIVATHNGYAIRIRETDIREMSRVAHGVKAIKLRGSDYVVSMARVREGASVLTVAENGLGRRVPLESYKVQNRGGKGIKGMNTIDNDIIDEIFLTNTHNFIMFFTNMGRVYRLKAYEIPEAGRTARGTAIVNLLQLAPGEKITAMIPIREYSDDKNLFMVTKTGIVKKTPLMEFSNVRKNGLTAINLREEDELIEVKITDSNSEIFLVTKQGMCIRFQETDVRATGRASMGVIGMNLSPGDEIIGMQLQTQGSDLLIVSENGMGKRTNMDEFTVQKRGGKGVKCYKIVEKTGDVVGAKAVNDDNEIMMITTEGIIIQLRVQDISTLSRITSGVKLINLDNGVKVAQIAKVREKLSNGDHEFDNLEEAMEEVAQEAVSEDEDEAEENLIFPTEDSEDDE